MSDIQRYSFYVDDGFLECDAWEDGEIIGYRVIKQLDDWKMPWEVEL